MKKAVHFVLFCGALLLVGVTGLRAQSTLEQAIAASFPFTKATADRSDIVTAGAVMTLKKDHVIMFGTGETLKSSLQYKDGKISPTLGTRMTAFGFDGKPSTGIVQRTYVAGEKLWLLGVQMQKDGVNLVFLSDPVGDNRYTTSIKFFFPKGPTPNNEQIVAQIGEVITPDGGAAPTSAPGAPAEAPIVAPPPPPGGGADSGAAAQSASGAWRVVDPAQQSAMIAGFATTNGRKHGAVLAVGCSVDPKTGQGSPNAEVRIHLGDLGVKTDFFRGYSDGYDQVSVIVGNAKAETVDFDPSYPDDNAKPTQVLTFKAFITPILLNTFASSPGAPVEFRFNSVDLHRDFLVGNFMLPGDQGAAAPVFKNCQVAAQLAAKAAEAAARKYKADTVVACPVLNKLTLDEVHVTTATGKEIDEEEGEDEGVWNLPHATKAHPVAPKLTLKCTYQVEGGAAASTRVERRLPIPAVARTCHSDGKTAACLR